MNKIIKTKLIDYHFVISDKTESNKWYELKAKLKKTHSHFHVIAEPSEKRKISGIVHLETKHLFSNQWNSSACSPTNPNYRIFDWYEGIYSNKDVKAGHYIEITEEMQVLRKTTLACGYCGKQQTKNTAPKFCEECLDSEYLTETELHLLRMLPISLRSPDRAELNELEKKLLLPKYTHRQFSATDSRNRAKREKQLIDIQDKFQKVKFSNEQEKDGFVWLMKNNINIDNCIYYNHRNIFSFGWRNPVANTVKSMLLDKLTEFNFPYEIVGEKETISTIEK